MTADRSRREAHFLDALYLGVRDPGGFDSAVRLLGGLFDVESGTLLDFDASRPEVSMQASFGTLSGAAWDVYHRDFAALDPAPPAFMRQPVGTAIPTYRLLPHEKKKPSVFFGEFFRPLGLEECLGGTIASSKGHFAMIGLHRAPKRRPFDDDDIARLEAMMAHLARALSLRRSFLEVEGLAGALTEVCERLSAGVAALDAGGRSLFVNRAARAMASANDGFAIDRAGRPFAVDSAANRHLSSLVDDIGKGGAGGIVRVPRIAGGRPYVIVVAPNVAEETSAVAAPAPRGVLFVIHDPMQRKPAPAETIKRIFGLPGATSRLVAALMVEEDLQAFAERSGITMNTVHYHMKSAFQRLEVRRQSELVRLVTEALRDLADHRN